MRSIMGFLPVVKEGPKGLPSLKATDFQTIPIAIPIDIPIAIPKTIPIAIYISRRQTKIQVFTWGGHCSSPRGRTETLNHDLCSFCSSRVVLEGSRLDLSNQKINLGIAST